MPMVAKGSIAVAMVQRQVVIVQAARTHTQFDLYLDVFTYIPFGNRTFLASSVPQARISPLDILTIFPGSDVIGRPERGMLELPPQAFKEFMELSAMTQKRYETLFSAWSMSGKVGS